MLYFVFLLGGATITVEYIGTDLESLPVLNFIPSESMIVGIDKNIAIRALGDGIKDDPRDVVIFPSRHPRGGTVVFTLGIQSFVAARMSMMKMEQVNSFRLFNIEIVTNGGEVMRFEECAFGVQSDTEMSQSSIEFVKSSFVTE